jgi:hypothetical protein
MIGYIRDNIGSVRTAKDRLRTFHLSFFVLVQITRAGGTNVLTAQLLSCVVSVDF